MIFEKLQTFRKTVYANLGRARDAVFDLMDAALTTASAASFVSLTLSPLFRRQWSSAYAALRKSRVPRHRLMREYISEIPTQSQPFLAGDHTAWSRPDAPTLKDRTFEHDPMAGKVPVSVGQGYSTLVWVPEDSGSWALPLRHERITSFETPLSKAAFQLKQVTRHLSVRPLVGYDREYGNSQFVNQTASIEADLLLCIASNRCLFGAPPPYSGRGAPRKHGAKCKLNDPDTWGEASETLIVDDPDIGQVQVKRWSRLHFRQSANREMELMRVEVQVPVGRKRKFAPLWIAWIGQTRPPLSQLWRKYLRRFACDHWYRFAKQRLHWTLPQITDVQTTERWSDLMPLLTWQLWLAREGSQDHPLPWQAPQDNLAPGRVAQGFGAILAAIGTPAKPPTTRGKSPGAKPGIPRTLRPRYPTVKKRAARTPKSELSPKPTSPQAA